MLLAVAWCRCRHVSWYLFVVMRWYDVFILIFTVDFSLCRTSLDRLQLQLDMFDFCTVKHLLNEV